MNVSSFRTVLIGFGKIGVGYADDPVMARTLPYATHAQVLRDHAAFNWNDVVDPSPEALEQASNRWHIANTVSHIDLMSRANEIEVAVLATPPEARMGFIDKLPNLKAVVVEKPLGENLEMAEHFLEACDKRNILVQVNLPRRAERNMRALRDGGLKHGIGPVQAAFGVYGNGLNNNATHLIDLTRQLMGDVKSVQASTAPPLQSPTPLPGDINVGFTLTMENDIVVMVQPLEFSHYREIGLDLWGEKGRLSILNEGYTLIEAKRFPNRLISTDHEIACDVAKSSTTDIGHALFDLYDNLSCALKENVPLLSPGTNALQTMKVVTAIRASYSADGCRINVAEDFTND